VSDTYELLNKPQRKKHKAPGKRHTLGRYNTSATRIERKGDKPLRRGQTDSTKICSEKATFIEDCQKTNLNATWRCFLTCLDTSVFSSLVFRQPAQQFQELFGGRTSPGLWQRRSRLRHDFVTHHDFDSGAGVFLTWRTNSGTRLRAY
jgi:hypothetical protein